MMQIFVTSLSKRQDDSSQRENSNKVNKSEIASDERRED